MNYGMQTVIKGGTKMIFNIPYKIGQSIKIDGVKHTITGIDIYIGKTRKPDYIRIRTDKSNQYITLKKRYGFKGV